METVGELIVFCMMKYLSSVVNEGKSCIHNESQSLIWDKGFVHDGVPFVTKQGYPEMLLLSFFLSFQTIYW